ncbi:MAG: DEAD/DEAH box helicase [bacterium]|nr:DEAD/DEAH box helicase [bacterium]
MNRNFSIRKKGRAIYPSRFKRSGFSGYKRNSQRGEFIDPQKFVNKTISDQKYEYFVPQHKFQDFKINQQILKNIINRGYIIPTPIQDQVIPNALKGHDIVGIANTGTGKTAAFLIPLINKILLDPREKVLIATPTRELALQINQEFILFAKGMRIFSVCCVGGANIGRQISELSRNHNLIVGTTGRLKDLIERKKINLSKFNTVVLDEVDRMMDMGFIDDTRLIMNNTPKEKQVLLFSATISYKIENLINDFLRNPIKISVKTGDTARNIEQDVVKITSNDRKIDVLHGLLVKEEFSKVLIFGRTKHGVESLSKMLIHKGLKVESIHGNKNHSQRQRALGMFKENRVQVLVATDVAARGLDIDNVSHVINYDLPATYDDYIHRIGRTGRGDKGGKSLTFID